MKCLSRSEQPSTSNRGPQGFFCSSLPTVDRSDSYQRTFSCLMVFPIVADLSAHSLFLACTALYPAMRHLNRIRLQLLKHHILLGFRYISMLLCLALFFSGDFLVFFLTSLFESGDGEEDTDRAGDMALAPVDVVVNSVPGSGAVCLWGRVGHHFALSDDALCSCPFWLHKMIDWFLWKE